jgi:hypothetical protein
MSMPQLILKIETFKILANGLVIGIIAIWIKYLLDESAKSKETEKVRQTAKKELFLGITATLNTALVAIGDEKVSSMTNFPALFTAGIGSGDRKQYEELLLNWKNLEPNKPVKGALDDYRSLEKKFIENKWSDAFRKVAKPKVMEWREYFQNRSMGLEQNPPKNW